jgi:hypothetical protein
MTSLSLDEFRKIGKIVQVFEELNLTSPVSSDDSVIRRRNKRVGIRLGVRQLPQ